MRRLLLTPGFQFHILHMLPVFPISALKSLVMMCACLLMTPLLLDAQTRIPHSEFVIENWSVNDGLPVNNVLKLHQTSDGYLWMVTLDGLVRFDGMQFKVYQTINYPELPTTRFTKLYEGPDGSLWIVSEQRLLIRFKDNEFTHIRNTNGLNGDFVHDIHLDDNGWLWFGTDRGISVFDGEQISPYHPHQIKGSVDRVFLDKNRTVWFRYLDTLENFRFHNNRTDFILTSPNSFHFNPIHEEANGAIWFSSRDSIYTFADNQLMTCCTRQEFIKEADYRAVFEESTSSASDRINYSFINGSGRYHSQEFGELFSFTFGRFNIQNTDLTWSFSLNKVMYNGNTVLEPKNTITSTLFDREGNLWVASSNEGLYQIKPNTFKTWSHEEGLPGQNVYPVIEDRNGTIWVGTYGSGVGRIQNGFAESLPGSEGVLLSLLETSSGAILKGLHRGGYYAFEKETNQFIKQTEPNGLDEASVYAMFEQSNGYVWLGTSEGLYLNQQSGWQQLNSASGFTDSIVRFFLEAPDGTLWMATNGAGIARFKNGSFDLFGSNQGFGSDLIRSLFIEPNSDPGHYTLWVGSEDQGLFRLDILDGEPDLKSITRYGPSHGMLDYVVHVILMDDEQNFWFNTNRGIFKVEKKELEAFHTGEISSISGIAYTENDGLRNREGNGGIQPAGIRASDGTLWFPGQDGVTRVDPDDMTANLAVPPIIVEELSTLEKNHQLAGNGRVELPANERDFEFKFSSLSFVEPAKNQFRYRLRGYNDDWIEAGNRRTATYTNIPAGDYTFEVMGSNNTGVWNPDAATLQLAVAPYFYETSWFTLLMILFAGGLIYGGVQFRLRKLEKNEQILRKLVDKRTGQLREEKEKTQQQADKLKELDRAKTRFFTNMSHEFRTPLTLIMGPLQRTLSNSPEIYEPPTRGELDRMLRNSQRLLRLMDQTLELTKLEHGKLKLKIQKIDLKGFLNDLTDLFMPLCEENDLELVLDLPEDTEPIFADPYKLDKIIGNLLSNAIKFTPGDGRITVTAHDAESHIKLTVTDTGIGIEEHYREKIFDRFYQVDSSETRAHEGSGIGLSLAKEFAVLHHGDLSVDSKPGAGTTFTLSLKKRHDHFTDDELQPAENGQPSKLPRSDSNGVTTDIQEPTQVASDDARTKVLVVEDNDDVRAFICDELADTYHVIEAANGKEALAEVQASLPDLIVADIMMPQMDGITFNRELKKDPATAFIPIIFLTAKSTRDDELEGLDEGADDYITKPFDPVLLKARVRNLIESRLRLRHLLQAKGQTGMPVEEEISFLSETDPDPFIRDIAEVLEAHFSDPEFQVSTLAELLHLDRSYMARKIKKTTGLTPGEVIKTYRMEKAAALLKENQGNISEVAYAVGFNSLSYFSHTFKEHFGKTPSEFLSFE